MGLGMLEMHPWDFGRYTLGELFERVQVYVEKRQQLYDRLEYQVNNNWRQIRWSTFRILKGLGADITSEYQLMSLPGDPKPEENKKMNLLNKFPKKL